MSYKPDESILIAYLYGELEGVEKEKVERYLAESPEAKEELSRLKEVRTIMGFVEDKEVIAPPIVIDRNRNGFNWNTPYIRVIMSVAASLLILMIVGRLTDTSIRYSNKQLTIGFGVQPLAEEPEVKVFEPVNTASLTSAEVQGMIDASLTENNQAMQETWKQTQQRLNASIRENLVSNSNRVDQLLRDASTASQEQIRDYVASMQTQNMQLVKDYFQLTQSEQKQYMEDLLVDFAKYLQQQRTDDLRLVQMRLNSIEQNTDLFKQETEQILTSIISNTNVTAIKN